MARKILFPTDCHSCKLMIFSNRLKLYSFYISQTKVEITDVDPATLNILIKFIYTGLAEKKDLTPELLTAADKYNIPVLFKKCEMSLCSSINVENATDYFLVAYLHEAASLKQFAMKFIIDNNAQFMDTPGMSLIAERHPKALLEMFKFSLAPAARPLAK
jgi:hypothetical protein